MSFRGRLRLFFAMIVIVPMAAIGAVLFSLTADSEHGKADAAMATGLTTAFSLYNEGRREATAHLRRVANDPGLVSALDSNEPAEARERLRALVRSDPAVVSATYFPAQGGAAVRAGSPRGVAPAAAGIVRRGRRLGVLAVSVTDARRLTELVQRRTGYDLLLLRDGRPVAGTSPDVRSVPRGEEAFEVRGTHYRGRRSRAASVAGTLEEIAIFRSDEEVQAAISDSRLLVGAILLFFLLFALASSVFVVRALQQQVGQFLAAARRLASGRFDEPVETDGDDEFAQLGREFNSMSAQLAAKIEEVECKRRELEETIRRVGEAFAKGLDRQGIFELAVQTAVDACSAEAGRGISFDKGILDEVDAGDLDETLAAALEEAERRTLEARAETGRELLDIDESLPAPPVQHGPEAVEHDGVHALALPLRARLGRRTHAQYIGVLSIARRGAPFTQEESELVEYLAGQAVISIENADLHETVQRQAVTDELTGLANLRELHAALDREFERGRRFDTPVGFVLLDLDNFKQVNDTYGHPQGDEVLRRVARVLDEHTREIDEPARYGGEELAVVLPQTEIEGAAMLAERVRQAVEELTIPILGGGGHMKVTTSVGVASMPTSACEKGELIAAADAALYAAKRGGKNRVERAVEPVIVG